MFTQDDVYRIIREYLEKGKVTKDFLDELGIYAEDLINDNILAVNGEDYDIISVLEIRKYANICLQEKNFDALERCYKLCCKLRPDEVYAKEKYFQCLLKNDNFELAYQAFCELIDMGSYDYQGEEILYKVLFSRIIQIPDYDLNYIFAKQFDSILLSKGDTRYANVEAINQARVFLFNGLEKRGISILLEEIASKKHSRLSALISLIDVAGGVIDAEALRNNEIASLLASENYKEALAIYEDLGKKTPLKYKDIVIKYLLEKIVMAQEGKNIYNNDLYVSGSFFELILHDNFDLARKKNVVKPGVMDANNPFITILLDKITSLLTLPSKSDIDYIDIKKAFDEKDYNNLFNLLSIYLRSIGKEKYYDYVAFLVGYDVLNNTQRSFAFLNSDFNDIDAVLIQEEFEKDFKERKYANALLNFYMLRFIDDNISCVEDLEHLESLISHKKHGLDYTEEETLRVVQKASKVTMARIPLPKVIDSNHAFSIRRIFFEAIDKKGYVIHKTNNIDTFRNLDSFASETNDINLSSLIIGSLHISFVKYNDSNIKGDMDKLIADGDSFYQDKEYTKALKSYKKAVLLMKSFDISLMGKIALCYYQLNDISMSLEYLEIASYLCQIRGVEDIYSPIYNALGENEDTSSFGMIATIKDLEDYHRFDTAFDYAAKLVLEDNYSFEDACQMLNITGDRLLDLKLYYAEYAYVLGEYTFGDKLINEVCDTGVEEYILKADDINSIKHALFGGLPVPKYTRKFILK